METTSTILGKIVTIPPLDGSLTIAHCPEIFSGAISPVIKKRKSSSATKETTLMGLFFSQKALKKVFGWPTVNLGRKN